MKRLIATAVLAPIAVTLCLLIVVAVIVGGIIAGGATVARRLTDG